eukprot:4391881-Amphidinium_carterae.1
MPGACIAHSTFPDLQSSQKPGTSEHRKSWKDFAKTSKAGWCWEADLNVCKLLDGTLTSDEELEREATYSLLPKDRRLWPFRLAARSVLSPMDPTCVVAA